MAKLKMFKHSLPMLKSTLPRSGGASPGYASGWTGEGAKRSRHERGYGYAWEKLREQVLMRDCGMCQVCKEAGRVRAASQVDHIVSKADGGSDDMSNGRSICAECHKAITARQGARARRDE